MENSPAPALQAITNTATAPTASTASPAVWPLIWLVGCILCLAFFALCYVHVIRKYRAAIPVKNDFICSWISAHALRRSVQVCASRSVSSPMTYGLLRPVILLPDGFDMDDCASLDFVLLHEYTHICRLDVLWKAVAILALCAHWFNPLVWLFVVLFNRDLELACDERVMRSRGPNSRRAYAMTLLKQKARRGGLLSPCSDFGKNTTEERIEAMMKTHGRSLLAAMLAILLVFGAATVFATTEDNPSKRPQYARNDVNMTTMTCRDKSVYGIYDTLHQSWRPDFAYSSAPPEGTICLLTVYEDETLMGYDEISQEAYQVSTPVWWRGEAAFNETYGDYRAFGFENYFFDGRNVRGFWDGEKGVILLYIDPATGGLFPHDEDADEYGVYLMAVYTSGALSGLREISADDFAAIPGVQAEVEAIRARYFR